eukprot:SAG22_NODE_2057_length_3067_cov_2.004043_1_plen_215_part_10
MTCVRLACRVGWQVLLLLFPYMSWMLAEAMQLSGIVAILFCGIIMAHYTSHNLHPSTEAFSKKFFKVFAVRHCLFAVLPLSFSSKTAPFLAVLHNACVRACDHASELGHHSPTKSPSPSPSPAAATAPLVGERPAGSPLTAPHPSPLTLALFPPQFGCESFVFVYMGLAMFTYEQDWRHFPIIVVSIVGMLISRVFNIVPNTFLINLCACCVPRG